MDYKILQQGFSGNKYDHLLATSQSPTQLAGAMSFPFPPPLWLDEASHAPLLGWMGPGHMPLPPWGQVEARPLSLSPAVLNLALCSPQDCVGAESGPFFLQGWAMPPPTPPWGQVRTWILPALATLLQIGQCHDQSVLDQNHQPDLAYGESRHCPSSPPDKKPLV